MIDILNWAMGELHINLKPAYARGTADLFSMLIQVFGDEVVTQEHRNAITHLDFPALLETRLKRAVPGASRKNVLSMPTPDMSYDFQKGQPLK